MTGRLLPHAEHQGKVDCDVSCRSRALQRHETSQSTVSCQLPGRNIREAKLLIPVAAVRWTAQKPLSPSVYQMSLCVGSYAGADIANEPAFLLVWLGSTGLLKYATSRGWAGLRMSNTRSPDMMNEQATIVGLIRLGVEQ